MDSKKIRASDHDSYNTISIVAFLIPVVGLIIGAIMLTKEEKLDRKLGEHALVVSIFGIIIWAILLLVYAQWAATRSIENIVL